MKKIEEPNKETLAQWSKDPNNWVWGMFYYNPKDKHIFPPKKSPNMGWTVNFANTKSVLFFTGTILFFLFVTFTMLRKQ